MGTEPDRFTKASDRGGELSRVTQDDAETLIIAWRVGLELDGLSNVLDCLLGLAVQGERHAEHVERVCILGLSREQAPALRHGSRSARG